MPDSIHSHNYSGMTTYSGAHRHMYSGVTSSNPDIPGHVHSMSGETAFSDRHTHRYALYTGPEIRVAGGHTHYYWAVTSYNNGHVHYLYGYTSVYTG